MMWVMNTGPVADIVGATYQVYSLLGDDTYATPYIFTGPNHSIAASPVTDFEVDALNAAAVEATSTLTGYEYQTIWTHTCVTYNGGTHVFKYYLNGWLFDTITLDMSASGPFAAERIGLDSEGTHGGFSAAFYRSWAAELTIAEIRAEMGSATAVKATPFCSTPLTNASTLTDVSGNARNWTGTNVTTGPSTLTVGQANTNTTAANAIELAVPSVVTQSGGNVSTAFVDLWYKITWDAADSYISVFALGAQSGYTPTVKVYDGLAAANANTIYRGFNSTPSKPLTIPVYSGHVYYIYVPTPGTTTSPLLTISAVERNDFDVPTGSLAVNDDTDGFPLALLQAASGYPLNYVKDFPAGEDAHILPDGKLLVFGNGPIGGQGFFSYPANVNDGPLAGPITTGLSVITDTQVRISSDRTSLFYLCGTESTGGGLRFVGTTINSATWTASSTHFHPTFKTIIQPGLFAIAPSLDNTVLYYSTSDEYIQRWDLVTDTALADLASPVSNFTLQGVGGTGTGDILVMPDDTIVTGYQRETGAIESKVIVYNPNGSIAATYTYADVLFNHMAHDGSNATTIWMWSYRGRSGLNSRLSVFQKIDITDGSVVQVSLDAPQYRRGGYLFTPSAIMTAGQRSDPITRFGHSNSCAFWVTRQESNPPTPPSFEVIENVIRRLRRAPHLNNEHKRIFYPGIEIELQRGIGIIGGDPATQVGYDPQIMLRISRDGGQTWGPYIRTSAGKLGVYRKRAIFKRIGYARDAVFEITVSDPNAWYIVNAWLTPDPQPSDE
jgi:hypothetical protein